MKHTILQNTLVTLSSFIFVITVLNAWTGPSTTPPNSNVSAPLNVSSTGQQKTGGLIVGSLISGGSVQIGNTTTTCAPTIAGAIRWNTGVMEYCNGTVWGPFVGSSTGGGGNSSPYCAFSGQSNTAQVNEVVGGVNIYATCSMGVDATGYQSISMSMGHSGHQQCSDSGNNQDSLGCSYSSDNPFATPQSGSVSFNRDTGVLTCTHANPYGYGSPLVSTVTFTKDQSKCGGSGGGAAETDPTVLTSVKDGVSWSEVTGKPTDVQLTSCRAIQEFGESGAVSASCSSGEVMTSFGVNGAWGTATCCRISL